MNSNLKPTLEYLRRAELEFLRNAGSAETEEDIQAVKSEIDEFRNLVWSHALSRGMRRNKRAEQVLEAMRMQRVVEMLRSLNTQQRQEVLAQTNGGITLSDINCLVEKVCDHAHI
jgi:hypothetical protein